MERFIFLTKDRVNQLPTTTGVYSFWQEGTIIYIGKAVNIKDRVKNHFLQPVYKDNFFIHNVEKIGFITTDSEIEALILEAELIKKYQPKFNQAWRDDKNYFYVAITGDKKPVVYITHQKNHADADYIGPFVEGTSLKKTLKFLRKAFPYYTGQTHPKKPCTWCHLDLCPGPNPNIKEYQKNIKKLTLVLRGKKRSALNMLEKEMHSASQKRDFEKALNARDKMRALEHVMSHAKIIGRSDLPMIWGDTQKILQEMLGIKKHISKMECYDISNIQGKQAVGSMVVFVNGAPDKSQYKKFHIRIEHKPNDIAMLKEILQRRLRHPEWPYPEAMLIDGGIAQLNIGIAAKNARPETKNIKVISIAKGKRELLIENQKEHIPLKNLPQEIYNLVVHLDDQAHRFAITFHKKLRKKYLLI